MNRELHLFVCEHFIEEASEVVEAEGLTEVSLASFPANCGRPPLNWAELEDKAATVDEGGRNLVIGARCISAMGRPPSKLRRARLQCLEQCFHLIAGRDQVNDLIKAGAYLMTPGWLVHWRDRLKEWGFEKELAREFFRESATRLVLLDTCIDRESGKRLAEMAEFVDLPTQTVPVGLDFIRSFLKYKIGNRVLELIADQLERKLNIARMQSSEYAMALDLLGQLSALLTEAMVFNHIRDLLNLLLAPGKIHILAFHDNKPDKLWFCSPDRDESSVLKRFSEMGQNAVITESNRGFRFGVSSAKRCLAVVEVEDISFPEHTSRYLDLCVELSDIFFLAIDNARKHQQLVDAKEILKESEEKYRNLVERANDGIAIIKQGILKFVNPKLAEMLGYELVSLIDEPFAKFIRPDDLDRYNEFLKTRSENTSSNPSIYSALSSRKGEEIDIEINAGLIAYQGQQADLMIIRDITSRLTAEKERINRKQLQSVIETAGAVCHEMNQPLQIILGYIDLLVMDLNDKKKQADLESILEQVQRMADITKKLKSITKYKTRKYVSGSKILDIDSSSN